MTTLPRIDDFHCHLRDGEALQHTVAAHAKWCRRVLVMPNLESPILTVNDAQAYRQRILSYMPADGFEPLMSLYLTDNTTAHTITATQQDDCVKACKLYPAGATTHSAAGIRSLSALYPALEAMQSLRMPLLIHGEVTDQDVDIFDRESVFIETVLMPLMNDFPELPIVLEHITTQHAVEFIRDAQHPIAATITAHHLLANRNDMLVSGIKPHYYCLPILKRRNDQRALQQAATSGNPRFFLGSDSAPHARCDKESACGCAGVYTGVAVTGYYASAFAELNAEQRLTAFACEFGAAFYGLPALPITTIEVASPLAVPTQLPFGNEVVIPFLAGGELSF